GKSSGCGPACRSGASGERRGCRGGESGPAFVISSSGAPEPRESQPMTNGLPRAAADSAAGSTVTKSHSADELREGAAIDWIRYQGPLSDTLGCISSPHRRLLSKLPPKASSSRGH